MQLALLAGSGLEVSYDEVTGLVGNHPRWERTLMQECTVATPHEPHCPSCSGPVDIWLYEDARPGVVTAAGTCQSGCADSIPCDGGLLNSTFGEGKTLDRGDNINLTRRLVEMSRGRADQCLVKPDCNQPTIDAHTVSDNWMRATDPKWVYIFGFHPSASGPPGQLPAIPRKVAISRATTAGFACQDHDDAFQLGDQRREDLTNEKRLNLLFYRALLKGLHRQIVAKETEETHLGPFMESIAPGSTATRVLREEMLADASSLLRVSLDYPALNWRIRHVTRFLPGSPRVACSAAGDWVHHWPDFWNSPGAVVTSTGAWGITIMPKEDGHLVTLHHCTMEKDIYAAKRHLGMMDRDIEFFRNSAGVELEQAVSAYAIALAEDLCIGAGAWEQYPQHRKELIAKAWFENSGVPNGQFDHLRLRGVAEHEIPDLNLFR